MTVFLICLSQRLRIFESQRAVNVKKVRLSSEAMPFRLLSLDEETYSTVGIIQIFNLLLI